jgi:hypothetical protein
VLDEVLKGERLPPIERVASQPILPAVSEVLPQYEVFLAEIEAQMDRFYMMLLEKVKGAGIIEFSTLTRGKTKLEAIRMFILLLFLAQDGRVTLWQNEETEELYVAVGRMNVGGVKQPSE